MMPLPTPDRMVLFLSTNVLALPNKSLTLPNAPMPSPTSAAVDAAGIRLGIAADAGADAAVLGIMDSPWFIVLVP